MTKKILIDETVVKQALEWIEDATVVLSHTSTAIQGGLGAEAEGVGGCSVKVLKDLREALEVNNKGVNALAEQSAAEPVAWCPDVCPITGRPFFMWIEHHKTGQMVPTYGGPYDSYTLPVRDKDGSYCRERYDHDNGWWVTDEIDDVGIQIVSDQAYVSEQHPPTQQPLTDDELRNVLRNTNHMIRNAMYGPFWPELEQACRAIEAAHGITPTNKGE